MRSITNIDDVLFLKVFYYCIFPSCRESAGFFIVRFFSGTTAVVNILLLGNFLNIKSMHVDEVFVIRVCSIICSCAVSSLIKDSYEHGCIRARTSCKPLLVSTLIKAVAIKEL